MGTQLLRGDPAKEAWLRSRAEYSAASPERGPHPAKEAWLGSHAEVEDEALVHIVSSAAKEAWLGSHAEANPPELDDPALVAAKEAWLGSHAEWYLLILCINQSQLQKKHGSGAMLR